MATSIAQPDDFASMMPRVAALLLGEPNQRMSKGSRLRFGSKGSMEVDTAEGWFDDHEANERGGVLALIHHKLGLDVPRAMSWLEEQGLKDASDRPARIGPVFYDYRADDGSVAYRVERRGKDCVPPFLQHGPDGRGGFHSGRGCMQGVARLPYRLPEMLASDPSEIVFVVEGEKDADRLAAAGLIATTNSGGALKFGADLAPFFEGRRVVIIPDNDEPGINHAEDVASKLRPVASVLAVLKPVSPKTKGDVSDWLANGGSAHQLVHQFAEPALASAQQGPELLPLIDVGSWADREPEPRTFAVEKIMPAGEVTLFTGPGGVGKSQLAQQLATCFAASIPLLGMATAGGSALYVTAEDDERELHWRQAHICRALAVPIARVASNLHLVTLRGRLNNELATFDAEGRLQSTPAAALLNATIAKTGARLVILDNVAHLFAGNENDRGQVTAFANLLAGLCRDHGTTVVLIGHPNKMGDDYSGSTAWLNAVRSQVTLKRPEGDAVDPDARVLSLGKANYTRSGEQFLFRWMDFAFVEEGALPDDVRNRIASTAAAAADNQTFLDCLRERHGQGEGRQVGPAPGPNYAPAQFECMAKARGLSKRRLRAAMERLFAIGAIESYTFRNVTKGRDVTVIREAADGPRTPTPNASRTDPERTPEPRPNGPRTTPHTLPYTTYSSGAANQAAPPDMILAPGETGDDVDL